MRQYPNDYRGTAMDTSELDPCIAAESRMKKSVLSSKVKKIIILVAILFLLFLVLGLLLLILSRGPDSGNSIDYEELEVTSTDSREDLKSAGIFSNKQPILVPLLKMDNTLENEHPLEIGKGSEITSRIPNSLNKQPSTTRANVVHINVQTTVPPKATRLYTIPRTTASTYSTRTTTTTPSTTSSSSSTMTTTRKITPSSIPDVSVTAPTQETFSSSQQYNVITTPLTSAIRRNCFEHLTEGLGSGVYNIQPDGRAPKPVYCDMETDGGGWTVIQRRLGENMPFYNRTYKEYVEGFGQLTSSHWLGLELTHAIAPSDGPMWVLRIELYGNTCEDCSNLPNGFWWGEWDFGLGPGDSFYRLSVSEFQNRGNLSEPGKARKVYWEQMSNQQPFTAINLDNDKERDFNCAQTRNLGGWWHNSCTTMSLNGKYGDTKKKLRYMVYQFEEPLHQGTPPTYFIHPRQTKMMIRPKF